jgi:hypothetical protein
MRACAERDDALGHAAVQSSLSVAGVAVERLLAVAFR